MSRKISPSANRSYGVQRVARVWGTSRATLYRHRRGDVTGSGRRPGPCGPMPDAALVEAIRALLAGSPFHGEGYARSARGCALPASGRPSAACCG
jgi:putative transposase